MGNIYAAQFFTAAERALGSLDETFAAGNFGLLRNWLGEHVYRHGSRFTPSRMIEHATGRGPDPTALVESVTRRYGGT